MNHDTYHHGNLRNELIQAGVSLIAREGIEHFSLRRAAAACGVSHAAPYKHFRGKKEMLSAIADFVEGEFETALEECLQSCGEQCSPRKRLVELGKAYVRFIVNHPDYFHFLFLSHNSRTLSMDAIHQGQAPCGAFGLFYRTAVAYLESVGEHPAEYAYDILAMWSMVHGLSVMLTRKSLAPSEEPTDALVKHVLLNACRGFQPEP